MLIRLAAMLHLRLALLMPSADAYQFMLAKGKGAAYQRRRAARNSLSKHEATGEAGEGRGGTGAAGSSEIPVPEEVKCSLCWDDFDMATVIKCPYGNCDAQYCSKPGCVRALTTVREATPDKPKCCECTRDIDRNLLPSNTSSKSVKEVVNYLFHNGPRVKGYMLTTAEVADIIEQSLHIVSPGSAEDDSKSERWALDEANRTLLDYAAGEDADAAGELMWEIDQLGDERERGGRFIELWPSVCPHVQVLLVVDGTSKLKTTIPFRVLPHADPRYDTVEYPAARP